MVCVYERGIQGGIALNEHAPSCAILSFCAFRRASCRRASHRRTRHCTRTTCFMLYDLAALGAVDSVRSERTGPECVSVSEAARSRTTGGAEGDRPRLCASLPLRPWPRSVVRIMLRKPVLPALPLASGVAFGGRAAGASVVTISVRSFAFSSRWCASLRAIGCCGESSGQTRVAVRTKTRLEANYVCVDVCVCVF